MGTCTPWTREQFIFKASRKYAIAIRFLVGQIFVWKKGDSGTYQCCGAATLSDGSDSVSGKSRADSGFVRSAAVIGRLRFWLKNKFLNLTLKKLIVCNC